MEEVVIEIIKPVTVRGYVSGKARQGDKWIVNWFDGTKKEMRTPEFEYHGVNFQQALQEINALYQLNQNTILSLSIKTI